MLQEIDTSQPLWIFGYGSLIWHPGFPVEEQAVARLTGYHRAFCMASIHYRGTVDSGPGAGDCRHRIHLRLLLEPNDLPHRCQKLFGKTHLRGRYRGISDDRGG